MQSRLRLFVALVLLLAAGVHPLVHVATQECPCVHGAVVAIAAPGVAPVVHAAPPHAAPIEPFVAAILAGDLPARAPPVA